MQLPPHDPARYRTTDGFEDPAMTNGMRADEARSITNPGAITDCDDFTDFICHLLHLAHSQGHDPIDIHRRAAIHFHAEAGPLPACPPAEALAEACHALTGESETPTPEPADLPTFTAWCCQASGGGTIHIASFEAADLDAAIKAGILTCMEDWQEENPANIHLLGIAAGDVEILHWNDINGGDM